VLKVLAPIADETPVATSRIRAVIEGVLNAARARGHIPHDAPNPARWRGHLELLLPKRATPVQHFAALPYGELPGLVGKLRAWRQEAEGVFHIGAFGLEFLILTAARSGEVLGAQWSEIDFEAKTWTVPAARMKKAREHVVPLTEAALAILDSVPRIEGNAFIFPGARDGEGMCSKAFERVVRRLDYKTSVHGFRSAFADWCGEETEADFEVREAALAHVIRDQTVRAYRRGDALKKRTRLMEAWSAFLDGRAADNVIPLKRA
jgi:integrase